MPTGFRIGGGVPPAPVEAPPPGAPRKYGLFSASRIHERPPKHELNGVQYEPVCNVHVDEFPMYCTPYRDGRPHGETFEPMPMPKGRDTGPEEPYGRKLFSHTKGVTTSTPFSVYAGEDCFMGNHDEKQAVEDLRERFRLGEETAVERIVYHGLMGVVPALRYRPQILTTGGVGQQAEDSEDPAPISPMDGVGLLEHWLACSSGALGFIHAPLYMGSFFGSGQEISKKGEKAVTPMGHTFIFGAGYSGDAPFSDDGPVDEYPDSVWLYASRPVNIRRSPVLLPADYHHGALSMERDESSMLVERIYSVDWPCEVAAVQVDYPRYRLETQPVDESDDAKKQAEQEKKGDA